MNKNTILLIMSSLIILTINGCKTEQTSTSAYISYETSCIGIEHDGSETLRAWGEGKDKADAVEQAKKNAVYDVIFKGISAGKSECNMRPLINEVNAREKYADYFNDFFKDNGNYKKFISSLDEKTNSKEHQNYKLGTKYGVTVRVLRAQLEKQLKTDGLIK